MTGDLDIFAAAEAEVDAIVKGSTTGADDR
jgi:hypothetical protein